MEVNNRDECLLLRDKDARWFTREQGISKLAPCNIVITLMTMQRRLSNIVVLAILGSASGTKLKDKELRQMGKYVGDQKLLAPAEDLKSTVGAAESGDAPSKSESESESDGKSKGLQTQQTLRVPGKTAIGGVLIWKFAHNELAGLGYTFNAKPKV